MFSGDSNEQLLFGSAWSHPMRTMEEIRRSNERTLAAFDGAIAERQDLQRQYQELNQKSEELCSLAIISSTATPASDHCQKLSS